MKHKLQSSIRSYYFIFSLIITVKACAVHMIVFQDFNLFKSFLLEGGYIFFLLALVELISKRGKIYYYMIADVLLSTLLASIMLYITWFNTMPTYYALIELKQVSAIHDSISSLLSPLYILLYLDMLIFIFYKVTKKKNPLKPALSRKWAMRALSISTIVLIVGFSYSSGMTFANPVLAAQEKGIFNYEALNIYQGPDQNKVEPIHLPAEELNKQIYQVKGISPKPIQERNDFGIAKDRNVIVFQLESFQNFLINLKVNGQEVTPHLNSLLKDSYYFNSIYQQVGPGNTSDAEFILNTSLFPVPYSPTSITYGEKAIPSFPKVLSQNRYQTMTFHTDKVTFWNRDELYPALGYQQFYDDTYFGEEDIVGLASSDDVLFTKGLDVLKQANEPFYASMITLSGHHPYKIPEEKQTFNLPEEYEGTLIGNYIQAQHYTDAAIGRFIDKLKQEGLWDNSLLVFYGDHFGLQESAMGKDDIQLVSNLVGHPYTNIDRFNIPFIVTIPNQVQNQVISHVGGQLDFMPTIANLLGIDIEKELPHFGQDLLNYPSNTIGMRYYMPPGSFITDQLYFQPNKGFDDGLALDRIKQTPVSEFSSYQEDFSKVEKLEQLSDRYLEGLPER